MRVVSLLPSATEIVCALGRADDLVGVTFECDHPPGIRDRCAVVVGGHDTAGLAPAAIDALVRDAAARGEDLYTLHRDALAGLRPDVIITQDLCRVCALPSGRVGEALVHLGIDARVIALDPYSLADVLAGVATVARVLAVDAGPVLAGLRDRLAAVTRLVDGRPRPRVLVVEWTDPPFGAGHWIPDLVTAAGGEPVGAFPGARSRPVPWESLVATRPDVVVVAPCGYGVDGAAEQATGVASRFRGVPVWALDADGLVVRPGPRLVDGVEALAAVLHPDVCGPVDPCAARRVS